LNNIIIELIKNIFILKYIFKAMLKIKIINEENKESLEKYYKNDKLVIKSLANKIKIYCQDVNSSGLDIALLENLTIKSKTTEFIKLGIACEPQFNHGYYLYPRSSLSKTPLRLANSVGIIDSSYRGELIAAVDNISEEDFDIKQGQRLFQLCSPTLEPINYTVTNELSETKRGDCGFGSTGK
jgi:dUTP pyrophosphatase